MNTTILTSKDYVADNVNFPVWNGFHPGKIAEAIFVQICEDLPPSNLLELAQTCSRFHFILMDTCVATQQIWKKSRLAYFKGLQRPPPPIGMNYIMLDSSSLHLNSALFVKGLLELILDLEEKSAASHDEESKKRLNDQIEFTYECETHIMYMRESRGFIEKMNVLVAISHFSEVDEQHPEEYWKRLENQIIYEAEKPC
ncbi:7722_t:CDS:2 [Entrophospora sp. SA101]|nr:7722_t:CDS:2 [Entrophospora sp. SA101]